MCVIDVLPVIDQGYIVWGNDSQATQETQRGNSFRALNGDGSFNKLDITQAAL